MNIEPNKTNFEEFVKYRKDDINVNSGVGSETTSMNYYEFNSAAMNTFSESKKEEFCKNPSFYVKRTSLINVAPLSKILDAYMPLNQKIDFFNTDVEGFDLHVLKSNDWSRYRPTVILVEESLPKTSSYSDSEIYSFLSELDYNLANIINGTLKFISNSVED